MEKIAISNWQPISQKDMKRRGITQFDVIIISGDAYVDHPAFGHAIIGRYLESLGLVVGIIAQPNWQDDLRDFKKLGIPKLFFAVTSGNMDSMVNHYTAARRRRSDDAYTPGNVSGFRPDYAINVYSNILKRLFPKTPLIIGGGEASLRRNTHYDYYSDILMAPILHTSLADMVIYGSGERSLEQVVKLLLRGVSFDSITTIPQTVITCKSSPLKIKKWNDIILYSHDKCLEDKKKFANNFKHIEQEANKVKGARLIQKCFDKFIVVNPPFPPASDSSIDKYYDLPFTRLPHPKYNKRGRIPAFDMIKHSITTHRGCFGGCSFCSISANQGKFVISRSEKSIVKEAKEISKGQNFDGTITDLGAPSANMYKMKGIDLSICKECSRPSCIFPIICKNLIIDHTKLVNLFNSVSKIKNIKNVFTTSGIRYDLIFEDRAENLGQREYLENIIKKYTSGRFKVAPEHTSDSVLKMMRKPSFSLFKKLKKEFENISKSIDKKLEIIPYFISSHPGCQDKDMEQLANETKKLGYKLEKIQDFTPTPMTLATVMFYSGIDPYTGKEVYSAKSKEAKQRQRDYFFWYK